MQGRAFQTVNKLRKISRDSGERGAVLIVYLMKLELPPFQNPGSGPDPPVAETYKIQIRP